MMFIKLNAVKYYGDVLEPFYLDFDCIESMQEETYVRDQEVIHSGTKILTGRHFWKVKETVEEIFAIRQKELDKLYAEARRLSYMNTVIS